MCYSAMDMLEQLAAPVCASSHANAVGVVPPNKVRSLGRVTFLSEATVVSLISLAEEDKDQIWYGSSDIESFRSEARNLCRELRRRPLMPGESVRGLELRTDLERQERKQMTIKCLVKAQRRYNPRQLAHIYRRCNAWSTMAACAVAGNDFYSAYDLEFACVVPDMAAFPLPFRSSSSKSSSGNISNKRASTETTSSDGCVSEGNRRVRRRTEAVM